VDPLIIRGFAGSNSAINARLLPEAVGVSVIDAEPGLGDLRPLHARQTVATVPTGAQQLTIYREGRDSPNDALYWFSWSTIVSAIRGFDGTDTTERIYFTGSGSPKWTDNVIGLGGGAPYPQATRELGVPAPISAAIVTETTAGTGDDSTVFFVHTFVNDLGWESAPSPVSVGLVTKPGSIMSITALPAAPAGAYGIVSRRIYRTQPGTTNLSNFYFLREIVIGVTTTSDDARKLGEQLATVGWNPPPADAHGLIALWNNMAAMISGKSILFTEPTAGFYTTPFKYDHPVVDTPLALAKWEQNLLVLTTGAPVLLQGDTPLMSETPFMVGFSCRSVRSVVEFDHGVVWASAEGLAYTGSATLLTQSILTPRQWKLLNPDTMVAGRWGRFYVASYTVGGVKKGFMFDPLNPGQGVWYLSTGFDACWYDQLADALYVLEGGNVRKFDGSGTLLPASFKSKVYRQAGPRNFAFADVTADLYPITFKMYCDGVLAETRTVANSDPFTLPSGFFYEDVQVELSGVNDSVQAVRLADDIEDFASA
jgi:hypothetical protein